MCICVPDSHIDDPFIVYVPDSHIDNQFIVYVPKIAYRSLPKVRIGFTLLL